jgi:hypothetical protein
MRRGGPQTFPEFAALPRAEPSIDCGMDSLLAIFAAPPAAAALEGIRGAVASAARPFADVLSAFQREDERVESDVGHELEQRVAERFESLFEQAGFEAGQCATVSFDPVDGRVEVDHFSPQAADVAAIIQADEELMNDLRALAARDAAPGERLELEVQLGAAG